MRAIAGCLLALTLAVASGAAAAAEKLYSIQVRAVPVAERADGMATYRALRNKGYLVYHYTAEIDGKPWLRIAVGAFEGTAEAAEFGKDFSAREGMAHFLANAPVAVTRGDGGDFVVTPSALWTRRGGEREVLVFDDKPPKGFDAPGGIRLKLSPDRKGAAFQYGAQVYVARLDADAAVPLIPKDDDFRRKHLNGFGDEHIYGPVPHWSPSGRYVAFHDFLEFEVETSLWVARADGGEIRALVDNQPAGGQRAVKDFVWHPTEDRIFFVDGYAMGTVSVGGMIRAVDMDGTVRTVLEPPGDRQELAGPLRIEGGRLHYRIVQFDAEYIGKTFTEAAVGLEDIAGRR